MSKQELEERAMKICRDRGLDPYQHVPFFMDGIEMGTIQNLAKIKMEIADQESINDPAPEPAI